MREDRLRRDEHFQKCSIDSIVERVESIRHEDENSGGRVNKTNIKQYN